MIVESYAFIFYWGKKEVTWSFSDTVLVVYLTYRWELFLAEATVNNVLVSLIASREQHKDRALISNCAPDSLELGWRSHLLRCGVDTSPLSSKCLLHECLWLRTKNFFVSFKELWPLICVKNGTWQEIFGVVNDLFFLSLIATAGQGFKVRMPISFFLSSVSIFYFALREAHRDCNFVFDQSK